MQQVKKVEIIISNLELKEIIKILDNLKISGYTIFKDVSGKGERGLSDNDLDNVFGYSYLMTVCTNEKQLNYLIEDITPLLKKVGGVFLVTDTQWIHH